MVEKEGKLAKNKRAQITIFVIIAVVLVAGIIGYFALRGKTEISNTGANFQQIESKYAECIKTSAEAGISILGANAGFIYPPEFEAGSEYGVTSNELDFAGTGIPFWYYLSGNNIIKEQVPSKSLMQEQLARYIKENTKCNFDEFAKQGYEINISSMKIDTKIFPNKVSVIVNSDLTASLYEETIKTSQHQVEVNSKLGEFYDEAFNIYNKEKTDAFLEDYGIDVLRLYAPVAGVELECAPKVWFLNKVKADLQEALEANTIMLKTKGNYYTITDEKNKYFVTPVESKNPVRFLYSRNWATKIEVDGSQNNLMIAEPVGNQAGLGILGFCYVPYQFIYNVNYPVLIQIYDSKEVFQFPIVVMIEANQKRNSLPGKSFGKVETELCKYKNSEISVYTYNTRFEPVEADISFTCMNERCDIGKTSTKGDSSILTGKFPQCVNGFISARAEGYADKKYQISTNAENSAEIVLDKLYNLSLEFTINGKNTEERALIYFNSENNVQAVSWPEQKQVLLSEGNYNITSYVYRNSSIKIKGTSVEKCMDVPKPGLMGFFGQKKEQCFNMNIPDQELSSVISGGGKNEWYISESELIENRKLEVQAESMSVPKTLEELQDNYNNLENKKVYLVFKN